MNPDDVGGVYIWVSAVALILLDGFARAVWACFMHREKETSLEMTLAFTMSLLKFVAWVLLGVGFDHVMTGYDDWSKSTRHGYILATFILTGAFANVSQRGFEMFIGYEVRKTGNRAYMSKHFFWIIPVYFCYVGGMQVIAQMARLDVDTQYQVLAYTGCSLVPAADAIVSFGSYKKRHSTFSAVLLTQGAVMLTAGWIITAISLAEERNSS